MDFKKEINFFKFLTAQLPVSLYDNFFTDKLSKYLSTNEIQSHLTNFLLKCKHGTSPSDLNLYIHVPFCSEICNYCHCSKCLLTKLSDIKSYKNRLVQHLDLYAQQLKGYPISSLFFGGGTPSLLDIKSISEIFIHLYKNLILKKDIQINFEAHPSSLTIKKIKILKSFGVNRLSLGIQTLDKNVLKDINRTQNEAMVFHVLDKIREFRFTDINVDLIAGLPNQTIESFLKDLRKLLIFKPESIHITPFADITQSHYHTSSRRIDLSLIFKSRASMIREAKDILRTNGYKRIGFEAYSRKSHAVCQFEKLYETQGASVLGIGPYSNSILFDQIIYKTLPEDKQDSKWVFSGYPIDKKFRMAQFVILNFLGIHGISKQGFKEVFSTDISDVYKKELEFLVHSSLIKFDGKSYKYSGRRDLESLFEYFAFTKMFYGNPLNSRLKTIFRNAYKPNHHYDFKHDAVIKKLQDHWFMQLFFDMGL